MEHKPFLRENETPILAFKILHAPGEYKASVSMITCERREHRVPQEKSRQRFRIDRRDP